MIKKKKIEKPIEIDAHFKYICPGCGCHHWASLNETRTAGFRFVCDCKTVFAPKRIDKLKIVYSSKVKKKPDSITHEQSSLKNKIIDSKLLSKCSSILMGYGFTKEECKDMLQKAYQIDQSGDCSQLVKIALKSLGVDKNE